MEPLTFIKIGITLIISLVGLGLGMFVGMKIQDETNDVMLPTIFSTGVWIGVTLLAIGFIFSL